MKRILVVLGTVLASGLLATSTAQAGNWEETLLDPPPAMIEQGVTYTFGYWILQHGSYPYMGGDLGPTALLATDEKGEEVEFTGTPSMTKGHYSTEVLFPHDGTWTISSKHDILMPDALVATVTVPGGVEIAPSDMQKRAPYDWGVIQPSFPPTAPDASMAGPGAAPTSESVAPQVAPRSNDAAIDEPGSSLPVGLVILGGVATVGFAVWLGRRYVRSNKAT
ncbi:MAG: hypothetical protein GEV28_03065 [Actinophytocola sp.]|uniref:hypothetical protein n=1 Tax=Actinophytocola sp. TaxID=1872138 RepID=UPI0013268FA3|nr:hypothetical protein [Actinophytocola sp.]MPZ79414.1 hypothetical protein [Actinophytocola sp.]